MAMRFMPFARPTARTAAGLPTTCGHVGVGARFAVGDLAQRLPAAHLERRARRLERHAELRAACRRSTRPARRAASAGADGPPAPAPPSSRLRSVASCGSIIRRSVNSSRHRPASLAPAIIGPSGVSIHARHTWRASAARPGVMPNTLLERVAEAAVRVVAGLEHRVVDGLAVADALERARQPPRPAIGLERQAVARLEVAADARRLDAQLAQLALADPLVGLALDAVHQRRAPTAAPGCLRAAGTGGTAGSRRTSRPWRCRRTPRSRAWACGPSTTAGRRCRWCGRPGRRRRRRRRRSAGRRVPSPRAPASARAGRSVEAADGMVSGSIMRGSWPRRKIARDRKNDIEFRLPNSPDPEALVRCADVFRFSPVRPACRAWCAAPASAQLVAAKDGPIVYGHHHVNATNVDEHKKFWVDALGGTLVRVGTDNTRGHQVPQRAGVHAGAEADGRHQGHHVRPRRASRCRTCGRWSTASRPTATGWSPPPRRRRTSRWWTTSASWPAGPVTGIAYAMGPDDVKVEIAGDEGADGAGRVAPSALRRPEQGDAGLVHQDVRRHGHAVRQPGGLRQRRPARAGDELLAGAAPGGRHAGPRAGSHRLRGEGPRGVHQEARGAGHQADVAVPAGAGARIVDRVHHRSRGAPTSS